MIIEILGLPGSGKTTLCNKISKEFNVKNPMAFFKENFIGRIIFHIFIYAFWFNPKMLIKYNIVKKCFKNVRQRNLIDDKVKLTKYIKYALFIYRLEKNDNANMIIDEGIVHYAMAIFSEFNVTLEECINMVEVLKRSDIKYIMMDIDILQCINNIKKRNRNKCAIDKIDSIKLKKILFNYEKFLNSYKDKIKIYNCDELDKIMKKNNYYY